MRKTWLLLLLLLLCPASVMAESDIDGAPTVEFWEVDAANAYDFRIVVREEYLDVGFPDVEQAFCPASLTVYVKGQREKPLQTIYVIIGMPVDQATQRAYYDSDSIKSLDLNFDGYEDLMVHSNNISLYGGPSYDIFLYDALAGQFVRSPELEELQMSGLGMFDVDAERKILGVASKSGCCVHSYAEYQVVENRPVEVYFYEEALLSPDNYYGFYERHLVNGQWQERRWSALPVDF